MPLAPKKQTNKPVVKKKGAGVLSRLRDVSEVDADEGLSILFYGQSGSGKTRVISTFRKPLLLIGTERGIKSIRNVKGIEFIHLQHSNELTELVEYARESRKYKTVALDTATMLNEIVLREVLDLDEIPVQKYWGMASMDDYAQTSRQMKERLRDLLRLTDIGIDVAITAQERSFDDDGDAQSSELEIKPAIGASLQRAVRDWLNPAVDNVVETFIRQKTAIKKVKIGNKTVERSVPIPGSKEFCLRIAPHERYIVKVRTTSDMDDKKPDVLVNPTYEKLKQFI
jgi:hypothetical protein